MKKIGMKRKEFAQSCNNLPILFTDKFYYSIFLIPYKPSGLDLV